MMTGLNTKSPAALSASSGSGLGSGSAVAHPTEHPFARFVRILGKGPNLSRSLTQDEARDAADLILSGQVLPEQLGAFLCLLRMKSETAEEVAGLVEGFRRHLDVPAALRQRAAVELDWASWAGKARSLPWSLLAALALAQAGIRIFMHGAEGHTEGRIYSSASLRVLGILPAESMSDAADQLEQRNFAYATLPVLSPRLQEIMDLRAVLGIRSPLHTVGRKLNLWQAPAHIVAVTHPPYLPIHQQASLLLAQPRMAVFKGEGGEVERRPHKPCSVLSVIDGQAQSEDWAAFYDGEVPANAESAEALPLEHLPAVWTGALSSDYAQAVITGTMAVVLKLLGRAETQEDAQSLAVSLWQQRRPLSDNG